MERYHLVVSNKNPYFCFLLQYILLHHALLNTAQMIDTTYPMVMQGMVMAVLMSGDDGEDSLHEIEAVDASHHHQYLTDVVWNLL